MVNGSPLLLPLKFLKRLSLPLIRTSRTLSLLNEEGLGYTHSIVKHVTLSVTTTCCL